MSAYYFTKIQWPSKMIWSSRPHLSCKLASSLGFRLWLFTALWIIIDNKNDDNVDADNDGDCVCCLHLSWERRRKCLTRRRVSGRSLCSNSIPIILYHRLCGFMKDHAFHNETEEYHYHGDCYENDRQYLQLHCSNDSTSTSFLQTVLQICIKYISVIYKQFSIRRFTILSLKLFI